MGRNSEDESVGLGGDTQDIGWHIVFELRFHNESTRRIQELVDKKRLTIELPFESQFEPISSSFFFGKVSSTVDYFSLVEFLINSNFGPYQTFHFSMLNTGVPFQLCVSRGHANHPTRAEPQVPCAQRTQRGSARRTHLPSGRPCTFIPSLASALRPAYLEQCVPSIQSVQLHICYIRVLYFHIMVG